MATEARTPGTSLTNRFTTLGELAQGSSPPPKERLRDKLLSGVHVATPQESAEYFDRDDFRWAETLVGDDSPTGEPMILINDAKFEAAGATDYRDKMVMGESLHLLKFKDPERYDRLRKAASSSPKYREWADESYAHATAQGEERGFDDWHEHSRFDQVIGGYLLGGDESIPTMKDWNRDKLPFGAGFRRELTKLERDLGP